MIRPPSLVLISENIRSILLGHENGVILKVDICRMKTVIQKQLNSNTYSCVILTNINKFLLGHEDGTISLMDLENFNIIKNFWAHMMVVKTLALTDNNEYFLSTSLDIYIRVWKVSTCAPLYYFSVSDYIIDSYCFHKNGDLYVGSSVGEIIVFDIYTKTIIFIHIV